VKIEVDPDIDRLYPQRYANRVEMLLKDGRRLATRVDFPKGSTEHPLSFAEVAAKFRSLAAQALSAERTERVIDAVDSLDSLKEIRRLTRLLE
jgi:2-methylcitrate dehydratase PrpD